MGQAKRRGTYEQRKEAAELVTIARHTNERRLREERQRIKDHEDDMREAAMTIDDKRRRAKSHIHMAQLLALTMSMMSGR